MQILPYGEYGSADGTGVRDWTLSAGSDAALAFAGLLNQQASASRPSDSAPISPLANPVRKQPPRPLHDTNSVEAESPAGRAMGGKLVSREEFSSMRETLREQGYAKEDLDRLEERVAEGVTWRELMGDLSELARRSRLGNAREMSPERAALLQSLFQKTGFSTTQAESLVKSLAAGNTRQVLSALKNQLDSLPADKLLSLSPAELKALGESIELTAKGGQTLKGLMRQAGIGPDGRVTILPEGLRGIVTVLHNESADGLGYMERMEAMQKLVGDVLRQAQAKASGEANADRLGQDAGDKLINATKDDNMAKSAQSFGEKDADSAKDEGFMDLGGGARDRLGLAKALLNAGVAPNPTAQAGSASHAASAAAKAPLPGQVFQQVQSGILQNLSGGVQQLNIVLRPEHLGSVQVMLQTRDGELSGVIRADSPEAAKAISDQLGQLRQSLEQQGLKVANLDVQTGPNNQQANGGNPWYGSEGHNLMRERQERARMQRLATLRGQAGEADVEGKTLVPRTGGVVTSDSVDIFA